MISISRLQETFEDHLRANPLGKEPRSLYEPANYIMGLGGKRMRPLLLLSTYLMYRDTPEGALNAAHAIEVFHNYTLVHDDLMDDADVRRGQPSVHVKYGENDAILSGDLMLPVSYELLMASCSHDVLREVLDVFNRTGREVCEGQRLDMDFESEKIIGIDQYIAMNLLKTGALLAACFEIGAILAGAPEGDPEKLYEAGMYFGKAFQIQDDILDVFGDAARVGKKRGGDIVNSKKTFLYAATLEGLSNARRDFFIEAYHRNDGNPEVKIQKVIRFFEEAGAIQTARKYLDEAYADGLSMLEQVTAPAGRQTLVLELVDMLRSRNM